MRVIVVYQKSYPLRHIGHLDLMRTMQRALRRSGVPVRYSHGFNPHIQLSFASPLSVGIVGEHEIMDVPMEQECSDIAVATALQKVMPEPLSIIGARMVDDRFPTLMGLVAASRYRIEMDMDTALLKPAIEKLLAMEEYMALRRTKSGEKMANIREYIRTLDAGKNALTFTALNLPSGSLKPNLLMDVLFTIADLPPADYTIYREAILAKDKKDQLVPLEVFSNE